MRPEKGTTEPAYAVELDGLGMRFGTLTALSEISARIRAGRITGLMGPDAAGKTTLLRLMAGLMQPTTGTVRLLGTDALRLAQTAPNSIGYMPQRFGLYEDLSVRANLELHARLRGVEGEERETLFARLLGFTGLAPFTGRLAGRLSGGMKQKLGIACALLGSPRVLLLDEPGVGVDPLSRRELWEMVTTLCREGMTIIWSTAYLDEAARCPEVLMLNEGRLLYAGAPEAMLERVRGRVFALRPPREARRDCLARWTERDGVEDVVVQGSRIRLLLAADAAEGLALRVREEGGEPVPPRLEDAYMSALGGMLKTPSPYGRRAAEDSGAAAASGDVTAERIVAEGLTKRFGTFVAADAVSFRVRAGEIFGLLGPNGAGKSTTFRMLCGLSRPRRANAGWTGWTCCGRAVWRAPGWATWRRSFPFTRTSAWPRTSAFLPICTASAAGNSGSACRALRRPWALRPSGTAGRTACRWGRNSASPCCAPPCTSRRCSFSMNRPPAWMPAPAVTSGSISLPSPPPGRPCW